MSEKLLILQNLDESDDSRDALSLATLEAAGRGDGPRAARCRAAFAAYTSALEAGQPKAQAKASALAAMRETG